MRERSPTDWPSDYSVRTAGKRVGHDGVTRAEASAVAAGGDDDKLPAVCAVGHRRRLAGGGQGDLPELAAGAGLEGAKSSVERCGDEGQSAGGSDRPAEI